MHTDGGSRRKVIATATTVAVLGSLVATAAAGAQGLDTDRWVCRASAGYVMDARSGQKLEPVVATGVPDGIAGRDIDFPCADVDRGASVTVGENQPGSPGQASVNGAYARTRAAPDFAETHVQKVESEGGLASVRIASGSFTLTAGAARAKVEASCLGGSPAINTGGEVANVTVNGSRIVTDQPFEQAGLIINGAPLGGRIKIFFNEIVSELNANNDPSYTRRAIRASIFDSAGVELVRAVVGEARVDVHRDVCAVPPVVCPAGAVLDETVEPAMCVVRVFVDRTPTGECPPGTTPAAGNRCVQTIVLGPPGDQGSGGTIVLLEELRNVGPCRTAGRRFGTQVAIVGTSHADRITGSNKSDRIFGYAGNDRVSGGRGNECIEGGAGSDQLDGSNGSDFLFGDAGNDNLSGGQRNDRLEGGSGNDKLSGGTLNDRLVGGKGNDRVFGGAGNDRLYGGPGNDVLNTNNGRDQVYAGSGNDAINAATAGPPALVDCGSGFDIVRVNTNERHRIRNCERIFVISLVR